MVVVGWPLNVQTTSVIGVLDPRSLDFLRPHWPNAAMGDKALADLVAVVDQVRGKNQADADGGRL
jgi:hypothetical protein